jgi:diguanylate cyclase (GGDEF)-like protein
MAIGFRGRLITAMVALVGVVSLTIGAMLMVYLFEDEQARAREQLQLAEQVSREMLDRQTEVYLSRLDVVTRDFGLRSAIASADRATIESALANHLDRAGAGFGAIVSSDGRLLATTGLGKGESLPAQLQTSTTQGQHLVMYRGRGFEVLTIPVQAAGLRASLLAGFSLDQGLASLITRLSGVQSVLRGAAGPDTGYDVFAQSGSIPAETIAALEKPASRGDLPLDDDSHPYFNRVIELSQVRSGAMQIVLLLDRATSLQRYYERALEIALLVAGILLIAAVLALLMARNLGRPVLQLAAWARAFGQGRNDPVPRIHSGGELQELAHAMSTMQENLRRREAEISWNASHDDVTGVFNRNAILQRIEEHLGESRPSSLIGIRLPGLSRINDTFGLDFGDKVLNEVSERLHQALPESAMLARSGGNEFLILEERLTPQALTDLAYTLKKVTEQSRKVVDVQFTLRSDVVTLQLPEDARDKDQTRRCVNLTFKKAEYSNLPVVEYQAGDDESHLRELQIIRDLPEALTGGVLHMNYQPKLDMQTGEMVQVEALVRWVHPELGFIPPDEFIALAESSGQVNQLTRYILQRIAVDAAAWEEAGLDIGIAANLSALDLSREELPDEISEVFTHWQDRMSRITLEVTESAVMKEPETAMRTLQRLRDLGVTLAVDDFGTGYSSLSQLRAMPVQELKIDKSFVLKLASEVQDQLIVRSTLEMAHGLELKVVAEGIEDINSWRLLREWGCNLGQGFFMSRPVAPEKLPEVARNITSRHQELTRR